MGVQERQKLRRLAEAHRLTEWHWVAACILGSIHGFDAASEYVRECMSHHAEVQR